MTVSTAINNVINPNARSLFQTMVSKIKNLGVTQADDVTDMKKLSQLINVDKKDIFKLQNITKEGHNYRDGTEHYFKGSGKDKVHVAYTRKGEDGQQLAYWKGHWQPLADVKQKIVDSGSSRKAFVTSEDKNYQNTNATALQKLGKRMDVGKRELLFSEGPQKPTNRTNWSANNAFQWIAQDLEKGMTSDNVKSMMKNYLRRRASDGTPYVDANGKEITDLPQLDKWGVKRLYSQYRDTPEIEHMFANAGMRPNVSKSTKAFIKKFGWSGKNIDILQGRMRSMGLGLKDLEAYVTNPYGTDKVIPLAGKTNENWGMVEGKQVPFNVWMRIIYNRKEKINTGRPKGVVEDKTRVRRTQNQMKADSVPLEDDIEDFLLKQAEKDLGE